MGNQISSQSKVGPLPAAGTILGFVTFIFSVLTFLRVSWANIRTIRKARQEVEEYLGGLKQALYEERNHLRAVRRKCRSEYEEGAFRILADTVRHMIKDFHKLEEPFLDDDDDDDDAEPDSYEKGIDRPDLSDYYDIRYRQIGLSQRIAWLRERNQVIELSSRLSRIQTRRIARQTTDIAIMAYHNNRSMQDLDDRIHEMEKRLGRVVGLRRLD